MKKNTIVSALGILAALSASSVMSAPFIVNTAIGDIGTLFDDVITGTGTTVITSQVISGQNTYNYTDKDGNAATVDVSRSGGGIPSTSSGYSSGSVSLSGAVWDISPSRGTSTIPGFNSGLTFDFSSPVNAFGFEVGDWATCCMNHTRPASVVSTFGVPATGSGLWIAFDGGAATLPANALNANDNPGYAADRSYTNFIGAIDDTSSFSSVTFFGDGFGEFLVAGGTLRFASVPVGAVTNPNPNPNVPEPTLLSLLGLSFMGFMAARRRRV